MLAPILHRSLIVLVVAASFAAGWNTPRSACHARASQGDIVPGPAFTGQMLVATASMPDADFAGTRILMLEHDDHGAIGVVINRPRTRLGERITALDGGPLRADGWIVLHDDSFSTEGTRTLFGDVALTSGPGGDAVVDATLSDSGAERVLLIDGYAGWGPGQLERELELGVWRLEDRGSLWD